MYYITSLQNRYLSSLVESRKHVYLYLKNGVKLQGRLVAYSVEAFFLRDAQLIRVSRSAVSSIAPKMDWRDYARQSEPMIKKNEET